MKEMIISILSNDNIANEEVIDIMIKMAERLKYADIEAYENLMGELENIYYCIDEEEARRIVRGMKPYGEKWSIDSVSDYLGTNEELIDYYLAMNMAYNDYRNVAKTFGQEENVDFFYGIARDFINDEDAKSNKVGRYFKTTN